MEQLRVLITGSNAGFGKLSTIKLAKQGHHVIATMRNTGKADELLTACEEENVEVEIRQMDVSDLASVEAALTDANEIDVLVNNAGFEIQGAVELINDELMHRQLDTNVLGPLRAIRTVMPSWRARGHGAVINVSSVVGRIASPYGGAYAASKFALEGMSEAFHYEAKPAGIRVHLIEPGRFSTTSFGSNIIRPEGWEGSEFQAKQQEFAAALSGLDNGNGPQDPELVADAICRAVTDPEAPFRTPVGDDATQLCAAKQATGSFEEFEAAIRARLNWYG